MFESFTDSARRVIVLAKEESAALQHDYIGTEHLLLGLLRLDEGPAGQALRQLGIRFETALQQVEEIIGVGETEHHEAHIPFTPRAKQMIMGALEASQALGHRTVEPGHLLFSLSQDEDSVAARVLANLGADLETVRRTVTELMS